MSAYYELVAGGGGDEDDPVVLAAQAQAGEQLDAARRVYALWVDNGAGGDEDRALGGVGSNSALHSALMAAENRRLDLNDF